jgi:hypothetical protein
MYWGFWGRGFMVDSQMTPRQKTSLYHKHAFNTALRSGEPILALPILPSNSTIIRPIEASTGEMLAAPTIEKPINELTDIPPKSGIDDNQGSNDSDDKASSASAVSVSSTDHGHNLTYNIWQLHELKLLVRCKVHAMVKPRSYVSTPVKLQYLPEQVS